MAAVIQIQATLKCEGEGCKKAIKGHYLNHGLIRAMASEAGWSVSSDGDYCPRCAKRLDGARAQKGKR